MRQFIVLALLAAFAVLAVMAVVFRSKSARGMLRTLRNGALIYIVLVLVLGLFTYFRGL